MNISVKLGANQKGIAASYIVIGILVLAGLAGAYYLGTQNFSQPQPEKQPTVSQNQKPSPEATTSPIADETSSPDSIVANWKTYTNKSSGFSIRYPDDKRFEVKEDEKRNTFIAVPNSDYGLVITTFNNPEALTASSWIKKNFNNQYKDTSINGEQVLISDLQLIDKQIDTQTAVEVRIKELSPYILIATPNKEKILKVVGYTLGEELFNQILSTFKFTN